MIFYNVFKVVVISTIALSACRHISNSAAKEGTVTNEQDLSDELDPSKPDYYRSRLKFTAKFRRLEVEPSPKFGAEVSTKNSSTKVAFEVGVANRTDSQSFTVKIGTKYRLAGITYIWRENGGLGGFSLLNDKNVSLKEITLSGNKQKTWVENHNIKESEIRELLQLTLKEISEVSDEQKKELSDAIKTGASLVFRSEFFLTSGIASVFNQKLKDLNKDGWVHIPDFEEVRTFDEKALRSLLNPRSILYEDLVVAEILPMPPFKLKFKDGKPNFKLSNLEFLECTDNSYKDCG